MRSTDLPNMAEQNSFIYLFNLFSHEKKIEEEFIKELNSLTNNLEKKDNEILSKDAPAFLIKYSHFLHEQDNTSVYSRSFIARIRNNLFIIYTTYINYLIESGKSKGDFDDLHGKMAPITSYDKISDINIRFNCCTQSIALGNHLSDLSHLEFGFKEIQKIKISYLGREDLTDLIDDIDEIICQTYLYYIAAKLGYDCFHEEREWKTYVTDNRKYLHSVEHVFEYIIARYVEKPYHSEQYEIVIRSIEVVHETMTALDMQDPSILKKLSRFNKSTAQIQSTESIPSQFKRYRVRYESLKKASSDVGTPPIILCERIRQCKDFIRFQTPDEERFKSELSEENYNSYCEAKYRTYILLYSQYIFLENIYKRIFTPETRKIVRNLTDCTVYENEHHLDKANFLTRVANLEASRSSKKEDYYHIQSFYAAAIQEFQLINQTYDQKIYAEMIKCLTKYIKYVCHQNEGVTGLSNINKKIFLKQYELLEEKYFRPKSEEIVKKDGIDQTYLNILIDLIKKSVLDKDNMSQLINLIKSLLNTKSPSFKLNNILFKKLTELNRQLAEINQFISELNRSKTQKKADLITANKYLEICHRENLSDLVKIELSIILMRLDKKNYELHYKESIAALMNTTDCPETTKLVCDRLNEYYSKSAPNAITIDQLQDHLSSALEIINLLITREQYESAEYLSKLFLEISLRYRNSHRDSIYLHVKKQINLTQLSALHYLIVVDKDLDINTRIKYSKIYFNLHSTITQEESSDPIIAKKTCEIYIFLFNNTNASYADKKEYLAKASAIYPPDVALNKKRELEIEHILEITDSLDITAATVLDRIDTDIQNMHDNDNYQYFSRLDFYNKYKRVSVPNNIARLYQSLKDEYEAVIKHIQDLNSLKDQLLVQLKSNILPYTPMILNQLNNTEMLELNMKQVENDVIAYEALIQHIACIEKSLALIKTDFDAFKKHASAFQDCEIRFLSGSTGNHSTSTQSSHDENKSQPARANIGNKKPASNTQAQTHQSARQRKAVMKTMREAELAKQKADKEEQDRQRKADFEIKRQKEQEAKEKLEQEAKRKAEYEAERHAEQQKLEKMLKQKEQEIKTRNNILLNGKGAKISFADLSNSLQLQQRVEESGPECLWVGSFAHRIIFYCFSDKPWLAKNIVVRDLDFRISHHEKFDRALFMDKEGFNLEVIENDHTVSAKQIIPRCIPRDVVIEKIENCPRNYISAFDYCGIKLHANIDKMTDRKERDIVPIGDYFAEICIPPKYRQTIINTCQSKELLLYPMNATHKYYFAVASKLCINLSHALPTLDLAANVSQLEGMLPYLQAVYQTEEYLYQQFAANPQIDSLSICYDEIINLIRRNITANDADHLNLFLKRFFSAWLRHNYPAMTDISKIIDFTATCSTHFIKCFIHNEQAPYYEYNFVVEMINDHAEQYVKTLQSKAATVGTSSLGIFSQSNTETQTELVNKTEAVPQVGMTG